MRLDKDGNIHLYILKRPYCTRQRRTICKTIARMINEHDNITS